MTTPTEGSDRLPDVSTQWKNRFYERQIRFHPSGKYLTQIFSVGEDLKLILLPLDGGKAV